MGLFDLFGKACTCPLCRRRGAKQFRDNVKCTHSDCPNFDQEYASSLGAQAGLSQETPAELPQFSGSSTPRLRVTQDKQDKEDTSFRVIDRRRFTQEGELRPEAQGQASREEPPAIIGENRVEIRYRNHRGEDRTYIGYERTLRDSKGHITVCLAPTGKRAAFAKKWVQNLSELRVPLPGDSPSGRERRVLNFHKKKGSTSPLYEKLRRKYPNFQ